MIAEIRRDATAWLKGEMTPTGKLRDFKSVLEGDQTPMTPLHPALTFEWNSLSELIPGSSRAEWKIGFYATIYSSSLLPFQQGSAAHTKLLCRPEGSTLVGLMPALTKMSYQSYRADNGMIFRVVLNPKHGNFGGKAKGQEFWSFRTEVSMMFETWLNPSQIL